MRRLIRTNMVIVLFSIVLMINAFADVAYGPFVALSGIGALLIALIIIAVVIIIKSIRKNKHK